MTGDADFKVGDVISGRYRVVGVLGGGATGTTVEAQTIATGQHVAVKRLRLRGASSWKSVEMFEREARVLASLSHPAVPRQVEFFCEESQGEADFYLVRTLAHGDPLDRWLASKGRASESDARGLAEQVLEVLAYIHGLIPPVIHRDIKPANLIRDANGGYSVVDFGSVRIVDADSPGGTTAVGTHGFMAPEQYRGVAAPASDLYGLGATLVFMLTGQSPDQLPQKRLRVELPASLRLSKPFASWLRRMLEPAPEDRFTSAAEALTALRTNAGGAARRGSSRLRIAALLGALAVVAGGAVFGMRVLDRRFPVASSANARPTGAALPPLPPILDRPRKAGFLSEGTIRAHTKGVFSLDVAPDGKAFVTASGDGTVKVWAAPKWDLLTTLDMHRGKVVAATYTRDGRSIVTADESKVRLFDAKSFELRGEASAGAAITKLAVDESRVYASCMDGTVRSYSLPGLEQTGSVNHGAGRALSVAVSRDGSMLASSGDGGVSRLWSLPALAPLRDLPLMPGSIGSVAFSRDGKLVGAAADGGFARISLVGDGQQRFAAIASGETWAVAFSPDGTVYAVADSQSNVQLRSASTGWLLWSWNFRAEGFSALSFSPDGRRLIIGSIGGGVMVLTLADPKDADSLPRPAKELTDRPPPSDSPAEKARALLYSYKGNRALLVEAEKAANEALDKNPKDALALTQLARIAYKRAYLSGQKYGKEGIQQARDYIERALAADARLPDALLTRAWVELWAATSSREDDKTITFDATRVAIDAAEKVAKEDPAIDLMRAEIALGENQTDEGLRLASRSVERARYKDEASSAYATLGTAYQRLLRIHAARAVYLRELELDDGAWLKGNYAGFLITIGELDEALEYAGLAIAQMNYPAAHTVMSHAYAEFGIAALWEDRDPVNARKHFTTAVKEDARSANALYGLVAVDLYEAAAARRTCADCSAKLDRVLALDPKHRAALAAKASLPR